MSVLQLQTREGMVNIIAAGDRLIAGVAKLRMPGAHECILNLQGSQREYRKQLEAWDRTDFLTLCDLV